MYKFLSRSVSKSHRTAFNFTNIYKKVSETQNKSSTILKRSVSEPTIKSELGLDEAVDEFTNEPHADKLTDSKCNPAFTENCSYLLKKSIFPESAREPIRLKHFHTSSTTGFYSSSLNQSNKKTSKEIIPNYMYQKGTDSSSSDRGVVTKSPTVISRQTSNNFTDPVTTPPSKRHVAGQLLTEAAMDQCVKIKTQKKRLDNPFVHVNLQPKALKPLPSLNQNEINTSRIESNVKISRRNKILSTQFLPDELRRIKKSVKIDHLKQKDCYKIVYPMRNIKERTGFSYNPLKLENKIVKNRTSNFDIKKNPIINQVISNIYRPTIRPQKQRLKQQHKSAIPSTPKIYKEKEVLKKKGQNNSELPKSYNCTNKIMHRYIVKSDIQRKETEDKVSKLLSKHDPRSIQAEIIKAKSKEEKLQENINMYPIPFKTRAKVHSEEDDVYRPDKYSKDPLIDRTKNYVFEDTVQKYNEKSGNSKQVAIPVDRIKAAKEEYEEKQIKKTIEKLLLKKSQENLSSSESFGTNKVKDYIKKLNKFKEQSSIPKSPKTDNGTKGRTESNKNIHYRYEPKNIQCEKAPIIGKLLQRYPGNLSKIIKQETPSNKNETVSGSKNYENIEKDKQTHIHSEIKSKKNILENVDKVDKTIAKVFNSSKENLKKILLKYKFEEPGKTLEVVFEKRESTPKRNQTQRNVDSNLQRTRSENNLKSGTFLPAVSTKPVTNFIMKIKEGTPNNTKSMNKESLEQEIIKPTSSESRVSTTELTKRVTQTQHQKVPKVVPKVFPRNIYKIYFDEKKPDEFRSFAPDYKMEKDSKNVKTTSYQKKTESFIIQPDKDRKEAANTEIQSAFNVKCLQDTKTLKILAEEKARTVSKTSTPALSISKETKFKANSKENPTEAMENIERVPLSEHVSSEVTKGFILDQSVEQKLPKIITESSKKQDLLGQHITEKLPNTVAENKLKVNKQNENLSQVPDVKKYVENNSTSKETFWSQEVVSKHIENTNEEVNLGGSHDIDHQKNTKEQNETESEIFQRPTSIKLYREHTQENPNKVTNISLKEKSENVNATSIVDTVANLYRKAVAGSFKTSSKTGKEVDLAKVHNLDLQKPSNSEIFKVPKSIQSYIKDSHENPEKNVTHLVLKENPLHQAKKEIYSFKSPIEYENGQTNRGQSKPLNISKLESSQHSSSRERGRIQPKRKSSEKNGFKQDLFNKYTSSGSNSFKSLKKSRTNTPPTRTTSAERSTISKKRSRKSLEKEMSKSDTSKWFQELNLEKAKETSNAAKINKVKVILNNFSYDTKTNNKDERNVKILTNTQKEQRTHSKKGFKNENKQISEEKLKKCRSFNDLQLLKTKERGRYKLALKESEQVLSTGTPKSNVKRRIPETGPKSKKIVKETTQERLKKHFENYPKESYGIKKVTAKKVFDKRPSSVPKNKTEYVKQINKSEIVADGDVKTSRSETSKTPFSCGNFETFYQPKKVYEKVKTGQNNDRKIVKETESTKYLEKESCKVYMGRTLLAVVKTNNTNIKNSKVFNQADTVPTEAKESFKVDKENYNERKFKGSLVEEHTKNESSALVGNRFKGISNSQFLEEKLWKKVPKDVPQHIIDRFKSKESTTGNSSLKAITKNSSSTKIGNMDHLNLLKQVSNKAKERVKNNYKQQDMQKKQSTNQQVSLDNDVCTQDTENCKQPKRETKRLSSEENLKSESKMIRGIKSRKIGEDAERSSTENIFKTELKSISVHEKMDMKNLDAEIETQFKAKENEAKKIISKLPSENLEKVAVNQTSSITGKNDNTSDRSADQPFIRKEQPPPPPKKDDKAKKDPPHRPRNSIILPPPKNQDRSKLNDETVKPKEFPESKLITRTDISETKLQATKDKSISVKTKDLSEGDEKLRGNLEYTSTCIEELHIKYKDELDPNMIKQDQPMTEKGNETKLLNAHDNTKITNHPINSLDPNTAYPLEKKSLESSKQNSQTNNESETYLSQEVDIISRPVVLKDTAAATEQNEIKKRDNLPKETSPAPKSIAKKQPLPIHIVRKLMNIKRQRDKAKQYDRATEQENFLKVLLNAHETIIQKPCLKNNHSDSSLLTMYWLDEDSKTEAFVIKKKERSKESTSSRKSPDEIQKIQQMCANNISKSIPETHESTVANIDYDKSVFKSELKLTNADKRFNNSSDGRKTPTSYQQNQQSNPEKSVNDKEKSSPSSGNLTKNKSKGIEETLSEAVKESTDQENCSKEIIIDLSGINHKKSLLLIFNAATENTERIVRENKELIPKNKETDQRDSSKDKNSDHFKAPYSEDATWPKVVPTPLSQEVFKRIRDNCIKKREANVCKTTKKEEAVTKDRDVTSKKKDKRVFLINKSTINDTKGENKKFIFLRKGKIPEAEKKNYSKSETKNLSIIDDVEGKNKNKIFKLEECFNEVLKNLKKLNSKGKLVKSNAGSVNDMVSKCTKTFLQHLLEEIKLAEKNTTKPQRDQLHSDYKTFEGGTSKAELCNTFEVTHARDNFNAQVKSSTAVMDRKSLRSDETLRRLAKADRNKKMCTPNIPASMKDCNGEEQEPIFFPENQKENLIVDKSNTEELCGQYVKLMASIDSSEYGIFEKTEGVEEHENTTEKITASLHKNKDLSLCDKNVSGPENTDQHEKRNSVNHTTAGKVHQENLNNTTLEPLIENKFRKIDKTLLNHNQKLKVDLKKGQFADAKAEILEKTVIENNIYLNKNKNNVLVDNNILKIVVETKTARIVVDTNIDSNPKLSKSGKPSSGLEIAIKQLKEEKDESLIMKRLKFIDRQFKDLGSKKNLSDKVNEAVKSIERINSPTKGIIEDAIQPKMVEEQKNNVPDYDSTGLLEDQGGNIKTDATPLAKTYLYTKVKKPLLNTVTDENAVDTEGASNNAIENTTQEKDLSLKSEHIGGKDVTNKDHQFPTTTNKTEVNLEPLELKDITYKSQIDKAVLMDAPKQLFKKEIKATSNVTNSKIKSLEQLNKEEFRNCFADYDYGYEKRKLQKPLNDKSFEISSESADCFKAYFLSVEKRINRAHDREPSIKFPERKDSKSSTFTKEGSIDCYRSYSTSINEHLLKMQSDYLEENTNPTKIIPSLKHLKSMVNRDVSRQKSTTCCLKSFTDNNVRDIIGNKKISFSKILTVLSDKKSDDPDKPPDKKVPKEDNKTVKKSDNSPKKSVFRIVRAPNIYRGGRRYTKSTKSSISPCTVSEKSKKGKVLKKPRKSKYQGRRNIILYILQNHINNRINKSNLMAEEHLLSPTQKMEKAVEKFKVDVTQETDSDFHTVSIVDTDMYKRRRVKERTDKNFKRRMPDIIRNSKTVKRSCGSGGSQKTQSEPVPSKRLRTSEKDSDTKSTDPPILKAVSVVLDKKPVIIGPFSKKHTHNNLEKQEYPLILESETPKRFIKTPKRSSSSEKFSMINAVSPKLSSSKYLLEKQAALCKQYHVELNNNIIPLKEKNLNKKIVIKPLCSQKTKYLLENFTTKISGSKEVRSRDKSSKSQENEKVKKDDKNTPQAVVKSNSSESKSDDFKEILSSELTNIFEKGPIKYEKQLNILAKVEEFVDKNKKLRKFNKKLDVHLECLSTSESNVKEKRQRKNPQSAFNTQYQRGTSKQSVYISFSSPSIAQPQITIEKTLETYPKIQKTDIFKNPKKDCEHVRIPPKSFLQVLHSLAQEDDTTLTKKIAEKIMSVPKTGFERYPGLKITYVAVNKGEKVNSIKSTKSRETKKDVLKEIEARSAASIRYEFLKRLQEEFENFNLSFKNSEKNKNEPDLKTLENQAKEKKIEELYTAGQACFEKDSNQSLIDEQAVLDLNFNFHSEHKPKNQLESILKKWINKHSTIDDNKNSDKNHTTVDNTDDKNKKDPKVK